MLQGKADKYLCILYSIATIFALVSSITSGIVWSHWKSTLNQFCGTNEDRYRNCSCILYAESTPTRFIGGSLSTCAFMYFGPVPVELLCIGFALYHGIRAMFGDKSEITKTVKTRNEEGETIVMQIRTTEPTPVNRVFWIIACIMTGILTLYMLIHFSIFADGYLYTCKQYRNQLKKLLHISGTAVEVIDVRLSCNAIYDFMDYLQLATGDIIRDNFINTAGGLIAGLVGSFFAFFSLLSAAVINVQMAKNS